MTAGPLSQPFAYGGVVNAGLLALLGPMTGNVLGVGAWADALREAGAERLTGIEPAQAAAADACTRYDAMIREPIEQLAPATFGGQAFSHVLAADVLEHLANPWAALEALHAWALDGATLVCRSPTLATTAFRWACSSGGGSATAVRASWTGRTCAGLRHACLDRALRKTGWEPERWRWATAGRSAVVGRATLGVSDPFLAGQIQVVARRV